MRKTYRIFMGLAVAALVLLFQTSDISAQDVSFESLRGDVPLDELSAEPESIMQNTDRRFARAYRQQPPLIPHRIEKYQTNLKVNQCLRCHDWPYNVEEGAPKVSETHYTDRNGVALDNVSRTRWFCIQCHVPQTRAGTLVGNDFRSAFELD